MAQNRPFILISNDDGYHANGIKTLVSFFKNQADLLVCAPESGRSGFSCAFSAAVPLRLKQRHNMGEIEVWSCNGTPVDCIKLALSELCHARRPDLILSGINHGDNASVNHHYSGTIGAAKEGCMKYIPSMALSTCNEDEDTDLSYLQSDVLALVKHVMQEGLPKGVYLNVNFPAQLSFRGIKTCRMAHGSWVNEVERFTHPRQYDYFWMAGHYQNDEPTSEDTDQWALAHGYVAVTPLKIDTTDYSFLQKIHSWDTHL